MAQHRLPGMSIDTEHWDGLTQVARELGVTRTGAIRLAIDLLLKSGNDDTLRELARVQQQLDAILALLNANAPAADSVAA